VYKKGQFSRARSGGLGLAEEHVPMNTRNGFIKRHTVGSADDSICPYCFLTVSAVRGGANLREMETRHKCDPMTKVESPKHLKGIVSMGVGFEEYLSEDCLFEGYLSAPNTTDAERKKILQRLKKYGRKQSLSHRQESGKQRYELDLVKNGRPI
jgi:hypothetical protein